MRSDAIDNPEPQNGDGDVDSAVSRVDTACRCRMQFEKPGKQFQTTGCGQQQPNRFPFTQPKKGQIATDDLGEGGDREQHCGDEELHNGKCIANLCSRRSQCGDDVGTSSLPRGYDSRLQADHNGNGQPERGQCDRRPECNQDAFGSETIADTWSITSATLTPIRSEPSIRGYPPFLQKDRRGDCGAVDDFQLAPV